MERRVPHSVVDFIVLLRSKQKTEMEIFGRLVARIELTGLSTIHVRYAGRPYTALVMAPPNMVDSSGFCLVMSVHYVCMSGSLYWMELIFSFGSVHYGSVYFWPDRLGRGRLRWAAMMV